jgi:hypothetical protein
VWTIRRALVIVALAACGRPHDAGRLEVRVEDCVVCHRAGYEAVTEPRHVGIFPETCVDCHGTAAWRPAAGLHPVDRFPLGGAPHAGVACRDCHDPARGAYAGGANTSCTGCHTGEHARARAVDQHRGVAGFAFDDADPRFCLACHPRGLADQRHPEDRFPIRSGAHEPFLCDECHRTERGPYAGGANTDCGGCHTGDHDRERMDDKHRDVGGYAWMTESPSFCLVCHPRGDRD